MLGLFPPVGGVGAALRCNTTYETAAADSRTHVVSRPLKEEKLVIAMADDGGKTTLVCTIEGCITYFTVIGCRIHTLFLQH